MGQAGIFATVLERTTTIAVAAPVSKWKEVVALFKLRLTSLVVLSAVLGYAMGAAGDFVVMDALWLALAGLLITGASNALNQVLEIEADGLMKRTNRRPLVKRAVGVNEAITIALAAAFLGGLILFMHFSVLTGILGILSLFMYVVLYTPMKRLSAWSVFVGAFPGAFPPMLGYVAATGHFGLGPGLLFAMQFMWQFPHYWAIAWVLHDDYQLAGYHMLPSRGGRDGYSALLIVLYTLFVIPVGLLPWAFGFTGGVSAVVAAVAGLIMLVPAINLFRTREIKDARRLMFASFLYLPAVLIAYVADLL